MRKAGAKARSVDLLSRRRVEPEIAIQTADQDFLRPGLEIKRLLLLDFRHRVRLRLNAVCPSIVGSSIVRDICLCYRILSITST